MRDRFPVGLLTLVTLEVPLVRKLLRFTPQVSIVAIDERLLLALLYWPPLRTDIDTTGNAHLVSARWNDGSRLRWVIDRGSPQGARSVPKSCGG